MALAMDENSVRNVTEHYRPADPVQNFRLKVTLRRVAGPGFIKKAEPAPAPVLTQSRRKGKERERNGDGRELDTLQSTGTTTAVDENEYKATFYWQQRVPSVKENGSVLFTYTTNDAAVLEKESYRPILSPPESSLGPLSNITQGESSRSGQSSRLGNVVKPISEMRLMAAVDIKREENSIEQVEYTLAVIKMFAGQRLDIQPPLITDLETPYRFTTPKGDVYEYIVVNAGEKVMSGLDLAREKVFENEVFDRSVHLRHHVIGGDFAPPPESVLERLTYFGEIVHAAGYDNDGLYVTFQSELPEGWSMPSAALESLASTTQVTRVRAVKRLEECADEFLELGTPIARFCFPFEFELERQTAATTKPNMYFQVSSCDNNERNRTEGYGYLQLPLTAGNYTYNIRTWKPRGTVRAQLRSMFIGGAPSLDDVSYNAIPTGAEGPVLNKYGFHTITTGVLQVRVHCVTQSKAAISDHVKKRQDLVLGKYARYNRDTPSSATPSVSRAGAALGQLSLQDGEGKTTSSDERRRLFAVLARIKARQVHERHTRDPKNQE